MWQEYFNKITTVNKESTKLYIEDFVQQFKLDLYSLEQVHELLENSAIDLFPERKVMADLLNYGNSPDLLVSIFYYWNELDFSWLFVDSKYINLSEALAEYSPYYFYKLIGFKPEQLLSEDCSLNTITFLFLYFLPDSPKNSLLYHIDNKVPLITFDKITFNHFEMLLYFMRTFDTITFEEYCINYNLNHLLLENFMDNAKELFSFDSSINWKEVLPIKKIYLLLECNCSFIFFAEYRQQKHFFTFEDLPDILNAIEKEYFYKKLNTKLNINNKEREIIKI